MERFAELMQRLLEIHGRERLSPELIEEDARLVEGLKNKMLAGEAHTANTA